MTKSIVLCADDYGQAPAITDGILALVERQRLSAVSCLVNGLHWSEAAAALKRVSHPIDMGLHFNLTEGVPLSTRWRASEGSVFTSLSAVLRRAILRQLDKSVVEAELEAQLDAFEAAMGQTPRFVDGHQHVHQFPVVREALLSVYERRLRDKRVYLRVALPPMRGVKQFIIAMTGALVFRRRLCQLGIPHNASFSGSYAFTDRGRYSTHFQAFMREVGRNGLIMCHPALRSDSIGADVIAEARFEEYLYFSSDQFLEDCEKNGVKIGQFTTGVTV